MTTFDSSRSEEPASSNESLVTSSKHKSAYDAVFWVVFLANTALMVAVAVLFRYADFVTHAGGTDLQLGMIVGVGTLGALAMRIFQGVGIDRFGPRRVWLLSLMLFVGSTLAHLTIDSVNGPVVYFVRILMMTSLAGSFGASITFISLRAPQKRMAEMIGMLGTSGFVGIALGPVLADWIFGTGAITRLHVDQMFLLAAFAGGVSLICAALATRGQIRPLTGKQPPAIPLIRRYHPGMLLLVAAAMGIGIGMSGIFLIQYAKSLGIPGIRTFFLVYALTAFVVRIATRRMPDQLGVRPTILVGLGLLATSMFCYLLVGPEWTLAIPAAVAGSAHALLFPSVMSGGARAFPARYRGLATTLMLAMFDLGNLIGQPAIGHVLTLSDSIGLSRYPTMFICVGTSLIAIGLLYFLFDRTGKKGLDSDEGVRLVKQSVAPEATLESVESSKP